jgi:hypothetical protein
MIASGSKLCQKLLPLCVLVAAACPKAPPPAPTVAWVQPGRPGVVAERARQTLTVGRTQRLEDGAEVHTPAGVRASLFLDSGAWVLLDQDTSVTVGEKGMSLRHGRAWVDARGSDEVELSAGPKVKLIAQNAGLSLSLLGAEEAQVYCSAGQVTWKVGAQGGRMESGLSLIYKNGEAKETAQALWDDWTYGIAEPGPLRPLEPAGVGQLAARQADALGTARTPLIVRQHDVHVRIERDLAVTEIEQTFFNPRSEVLEGLYTVRLPESAILQEFAVGSEDAAPQIGQVVPSARAGVNAPFAQVGAQLEWAGPGRYRGLISDIRPGKTEVVRLRYVEWLPHFPAQKGSRSPNRRTYIYPMGQSAAALAGGAPNLGEFSLEVDLSAAQAGGLSAGLGARTEGNRVVLRKSDFRPHADFVLDLFDAPATKSDEHKSGELPAYSSRETDGTRYLLAQPVLSPGPPPDQLEVVLVVDVSAATDQARLDLERAAAAAVLQQLRPVDRVAVLAASTGAITLGREAMSQATKERIDELQADLSKQTPAGATNLEAAFLRAIELLPRGQGTIIYFGDGRPTVGALLPGELRDRLSRLGPLPRFYAVAVGSDANLELLQALCDSGTQPGVIHIEDRPEAARAALHIVEQAAQPGLTEVRVALGEEADVVYPEAPLAVEGGDALPVIARLRRDRPGTPKTLTVTGLRDGKPFSETFTLTVQEMAEQGDLGRRWALSRLSRLLQRGAGREAVLDIGTRFGVVTPFTAMVIGGSGGEGYRPRYSDDDVGVFVPPALRDQAPTDTEVALEGGVSTQSLRVVSLDDLYTQALKEREAPARLCYERRAAGHPELSGRVVLQVKIALDGAVKAAKVSFSTLRAPDVEACIEHAVLGLKLPPAPDGLLHEVAYALQLNQPEHDDETRGCSSASRAYLATRRTLWRERLSRNPGVEGAMAVYREAEARCELRSFIDRHALLDLLRPAVGRTAEQVDLYHRFDDHEERAEIQSYLRREILRAVRTEADIRAAQVGLMLDGGVDPSLLQQELDKAKSVGQKIAVVRQFLALSPAALAVKLKLLSLLEEAGQKDEARRLVETLRSDPGADAAVRQAVGEYLMRVGDGADGARAFSEIVEFAPFDPWGRRRLGDLYRANRLFDAAYREYQILGWLLPQDDSVFLLLASAAAGMGRSDEALRLCSRIAEAVGARAGERGPAAWARALYSVLFARLRLQTKEDEALAQLVARGRSDGLRGYAGKLLFAVTWAHPDAGMQLYVVPPGAKPPAPPPTNKKNKGAAKEAGLWDGERVGTQAGPIGLEAQRYDRVEPGSFKLTVRKTSVTSGPVDAELMVLENAGESEQVVLRLNARFQADSGVRSYSFADGDLREVTVR